MSSSAGYQQLPQSVQEDDITERQTPISNTGQRDKRWSTRPGSIDLKKLDSAFKRCTFRLFIPDSLMLMLGGKMDRINSTEFEKEEEGFRTHTKTHMAQRI